MPSDIGPTSAWVLVCLNLVIFLWTQIALHMQRSQKVTHNVEFTFYKQLALKSLPQLIDFSTQVRNAFYKLIEIRKPTSDPALFRREVEKSLENIDAIFQRLEGAHIIPLKGYNLEFGCDLSSVLEDFLDEATTLFSSLTSADGTQAFVTRIQVKLGDVSRKHIEQILKYMKLYCPIEGRKSPHKSQAHSKR